MAATRSRATGAGYELAERTSEEDGARPQRAGTSRKDAMFDDGLSDDDEVEQLLTAGRPQLSSDHRAEGEQARQDSTGDESGPTPTKRRGSGTSTKDRGLIARMTGGMTVQQRRRFASEMFIEVP